MGPNASASSNNRRPAPLRFPLAAHPKPMRAADPSFLNACRDAFRYLFGVRDAAAYHNQDRKQVVQQKMRIHSLLYLMRKLNPLLRLIQKEQRAELDVEARSLDMENDKRRGLDMIKMTEYNCM